MDNNNNHKYNNRNKIRREADAFLADRSWSHASPMTVSCQSLYQSHLSVLMPVLS